MKFGSYGQNYTCKIAIGYTNNQEPVYEDDIISAVKFNKEGNLLGLGDKSGRVILFNVKKNGIVTYYSEVSFCSNPSFMRILNNMTF